VRSYDYWTTVYESGVIAQHISSIVIFIAVFINLEQQKLATNSLIIAGTLMTSLGYIFWDYSVVQTVPSYASKSRTIGHTKTFQIPNVNIYLIGNKTAKGALFFFATLLGLSPILRTLTLKTSDDTIYALTACLFIVNMLSHDYSAGPRNIIK
jgi:phosphatidylinositol glycan class C protein